MVAQEGEDQVSATGGEDGKIGLIVGADGATEHIFDAIGDTIAVFVCIRIRTRNRGVGDGPCRIAGNGAGGEIAIGIERDGAETLGGDEGKLLRGEAGVGVTETEG